MKENFTDFNDLAVLSEPVCVKLKQLYYPKEPWAECYRKVASVFTMLKKKARVFFAGQTDEFILKQLAKFSPEDMKDMIES